MDLGLVAQTARRVGAATDLRAGGAERIAVSVRLLLPLLQPQAAGGSELARDLRAAVAGRDGVLLLLPPSAAQGSAAARLDVGGRQFVLPAALRDALLAALARPGAAAAAAAQPAASAGAALAGGANAPALNANAADAFARAWAVAAQTTAAAAQVIGGSGATRQVQRARDDAPAPTLRFAQPLLAPVTDVQPAAAIAERLRAGLERSGLFFESHLAQWLRGERSGEELRAEALRVVPQPPGEAAQRVAAQLALLHDGLLRVEAPAWPGQPARLSIEQEAHTADEADADAAHGGGARAPVFIATLTLDLPQHGPVAVRLRLAGHAVGTEVTAADPQPFAAAFAQLAAQFEARGLLPVQMQAQAGSVEQVAR